MENTASLSTSALDLNHDVLAQVFSLLLPSDLTSTTEKWRGQLLNLALVCKTFLDPAMGCLWSHIESLEPLFKLHPGNLVLMNLYCFRGEMHSPNSSRYHQYARKVRTVHFNDVADGYRIGDAGYAWLGQQLHGQPLLPGLLNIIFQDCTRDSPHLGLLPLMLSPTIEKIKLGNGFLKVPLFHSYALLLICDGAPSLKNLVLHDENASAGVVHSYWDILVKIAGRLQVLDIRFPLSTSIDASSPTLLQLCTHLDNLTSLTLDVHTDSHQPSLPAQTGPVQVLPRLRTLHLINRLGAQLCPCYPSFLIEKATSVTFVSVHSIQSSGDFAAALDTLSTVNPLRVVEIKGPERCIPAASVTPFLHRLHLEELHVNTRALKHTLGQEPGYQILQRAAQAIMASDSTMFRLKRLTLPTWRETVDLIGFSCPSGPSCFPSLSCLHYVAQHIKGLEHLSISIDSSIQSLDNETVASMIRNWEEPDIPSSLRHLEIAEMRDLDKHFTPDEYRNIARLLDTIFPNLISVTMNQDERLSNRWDGHWQLIEDYRRMRRIIRMDRGYTGSW